MRGSISTKLRCLTPSGDNPSTDFCTAASASRKCGLDAIIGNGSADVPPLTRGIDIQNKVSSQLKFLNLQ